MVRRAVKRRAAVRLTAAVLLLMSGAFAGAPRADADPAPEGLRLAVVQVHISEEDYASVGAFSAKIRGLVDAAAASGAELVVFPEYLNVFLAAVPYREQIGRSETLSGALRRIPPARKTSAGLRGLLVEQSRQVRAVMDRLYGGLARRHRIHILAGTYFAAGPAAPAGGASGGATRTRLTNRCVLYGPDGGAVYEQDKVFLTDFESRLLGLDAGSVSEAEGARIDGFDVGITICRDLFFPVWERVHAGRDLWIDLRAEGSRWVQGREDFTRLLPGRIAHAHADYGATAALTGAFLDLFWEGRSSVVGLRGDGTTAPIATARSHDGREILTVTLD